MNAKALYLFYLLSIETPSRAFILKVNTDSIYFYDGNQYKWTYLNYSDNNKYIFNEGFIIKNQSTLLLKTFNSKKDKYYKIKKVINYEKPF